MRLCSYTNGASIRIAATIVVLLFTLWVRSGPAKAQDVPSRIDYLREIEATVLSPTIVEGPARFGSIVDYYCAANVELSERLVDSRRAFATGRRPYREMTLVAGSAGIGKTFIKRQVYSDVAAKSVWKFDIRELFEEFAAQGLATYKPDLQVDQRVLNRLVSLTLSGRDTFVKMLQSNTAAFVVVDSLDEVHPEDYQFVLDQLQRYVSADDHRFLHVVVFARPVAYREFLQQQAVRQRPRVKDFLLAPPQFLTTGDLLVSSHNYDSWKFGLRRGDASGAASMLFEDYSRWSKLGFPNDGEFSNVIFDENDHMTRQLRRRLERWAIEQPAVGSVLGNLAANGMVREIAADHGQHPFDEQRFMTDFLSKWLQRDTQSDDRPSKLKPEHLDLYLQLLEATANKYAAEGRLNAKGFFDVADDDKVTIDAHGRRMSVRVLPVLNRSGLVSVDPQARYEQRFRFEPFWFHRQLIRMHHARHQQKVVSAK